MEPNDIIAAIATPSGRGAIGIVRMSGKGTEKILGRVWINPLHPVEKFVTHRLYLGKIVDLSTEKEIDQVMAVIMKGPNSYTGEDLVEISCHGGPEVLKQVLNQLVILGARPAAPGEFTKRAFLNGKIDLAQAEGVASLIDAGSKMAARIAEEQLEGRLSAEIDRIKERLRMSLALVEAAIDFPEEDIEFIKSSGTKLEVEFALKEIAALIKSYDSGRVISEGVKTVIAGPPNAGKSSLMNALVGKERAIVHHLPGTTRDTIEETISIDGINFRLVDTAGIREAEAEVEEIGIARSKKEAASAEVVCLVLDGHEYKKIDKKFADELKDVVHVVIALNKEDLGLNVDEKKLRLEFGERPIFKVSATGGVGIDKLKDGIKKEILGEDISGESEGIVVVSNRHFGLLKKAEAALIGAKQAIDNNESAEFTAHHFRLAMDNLGEITGEVTTNDILNDIFSRFCIGK